MLFRLLFYRSSPVQLAFAAIGTLIGLTLVLSVTQVHYSLEELLSEQKDLLGDQYLVIQKNISALNTLSINDSKFSPEEFTEINQIEGISGVAAFRANKFKANIFVPEGSSDMLPQLYSDLFFESVPDEFLDVKDTEWKWKDGDSIVPIIVPKDYLNLYNFGFAPGQNMPQVSAKLIGMVDFRIRLRGNQKEGIYHGFIAGFSSRINSILVPETFLMYANNEFGNNESSNPSRLIIKSSDSSSPEISKYLQENGYESNEQGLRNSRLSALVQTILSIILLIGSIIIGLALLGIIQNVQLLISKSDYEIKTLVLIGHSHIKIIWHYLKFYSIVLIAISIVSYFLLWHIVIYLKDYMTENGYDISSNIHSKVYVFGVLLMVGILVINYIALALGIRRLAG